MRAACRGRKRYQAALDSERSGIKLDYRGIAGEAPDYFRVLTSALPRPTLLNEAIRLNRHRKCSPGSGRLRSRFCTQRCENFALGIPATLERSESCLPAGLLMSGPPLSQLLIPTFSTSNRANTDMIPPYGCVSMGSHMYLLRACSSFIACAVCYTDRLLENIRPVCRTIQRINMIIIMKNIY